MPLYIYLLYWLVTSSYHVGHSAKQRWLLICGHPKVEFWPAAPGILHHAPSFPRVLYIMSLEHGVGWVSHSSPCVLYAYASLSGCPWHIASGEKLRGFSSLVYGWTKTRFYREVQPHRVQFYLEASTRVG